MRRIPALPLLGAATACSLAMAAAAPARAAEGGAAAPTAEGGTQYAAPLKPSPVIRPVVTALRVPARVRTGRAPSIRLRIDEPGHRRVTARVVVLRTPGNDPVARISLGRIRTGATVRVPWPRKVRLRAGEYLVRVHAKDRFNHVLERRAHAAGRATMTVFAPAPKPAPAPPAEPAAAPPPAPVAPPPAGTGVFPVRGPHTFGDGLGADRGDHAHEGQDIMAAAGTPIVAPTSGRVTVVSYQASGAGQYVVMEGTNGRSFFFAHAQKGSAAVSPGQAVSAGSVLARVGSTGRSSAPHLHFEIWIEGWRASAKSRPVDPMPALKTWSR